jgi:aryl-alcohol dehydrogenase-like predicted oxidoreductase
MLCFIFLDSHLPQLRHVTYEALRRTTSCIHNSPHFVASMVTVFFVLLLTAFWINAAVVLGTFFYAAPFVPVTAVPKPFGRRRTIHFVSFVSDDPNDRDDVNVDPDDVDEDRLLVLPQLLPQNSIVWSVSSGMTELPTAPRELLPFPHVATLDTSGLLPRHAYYCHPSNDDADSKPTCRLQIAWDVMPPSSNSMIDITSEDRSDMVSAMQDAVDHGFTTFQMKSYAHSETNRLQDELYQLFLKDTPKSVNEQCQIIVPLQLQDVVAKTPDLATISSLSVRTAVTTLLDRLQCDCLDNLQISFPQTMVGPSNRRLLDDDRFYLDLLYELQELQRTGYIRSVSTRNLSSYFYSNAVQSAGLHTLISSNVMDANLCRMDPLLRSHQEYRGRNTKKSLAPTHVPLSVAANPLAGGWLTNRYILRDSQKRHGAPKSSASRPPDWFLKLSPPEKANWNTNIVQGGWTRQHDWLENEDDFNDLSRFRSVWDMYQTHVLTPLNGIARKHDVSAASIALRWLLQSKQRSSKGESESTSPPLLASTIVSCRLLPEQFCWDRPYTHPSKRMQQLREVVKFELDEEDMERLWQITGSNTHDLSYGDTDETGLSSEEDCLEASTTGLFLPKQK